MNKRSLALATLGAFFVVSFSAATAVKVGNFSTHDIEDLRIKVKFEDANGCKAKGSVHASIAKDNIVTVDLTTATNKTSGRVIADHIDMANLISAKIVKAQPKGFYSRAKTSNKNVDVIVIKDNPKDKYKTLKDGSKAKRLLKVTFK